MGKLEKGICTNCLRENIGIFSGGHCALCWSARKGLPEGPEREAALKEARERIWEKKGQPEAAKEKYHEPVTDPEPDTVTIPQDGLDKLTVYFNGKPARKEMAIGTSDIIVDPPPATTDYEDGYYSGIDLPDGVMPIKLTVYFDGPDQDLYHALQKATEANRRDSINSEVMIILEGALQDYLYEVDAT